MQKPAAYGRTTGASLEDLCQNYTVERLQQVYYNAVVTSNIKLYLEVGIVNEGSLKLGVWDCFAKLSNLLSNLIQETCH